MKTPSNLRRFALGAASLGLVFGLSTACGSSGGSTATASDTSTTATDSSTSSDTASTDAGGEAMAAGTLNANTASEDELKAAFETAGVPNAEKWADEIAEYRPFDSVEQVHEKLKEYEISDESWTMISDLITV